MATSPVFLPGEFHGQRRLVATVHRVEKSWTWLRDNKHIYSYWQKLPKGLITGNIKAMEFMQTERIIITLLPKCLWYIRYLLSSLNNPLREVLVGVHFTGMQTGLEALEGSLEKIWNSALSDFRTQALTYDIVLPLKTGRSKVLHRTAIHQDYSHTEPERLWGNASSDHSMWIQ